MKTTSPAGIRRKIAEHSQQIHELELQLSGYQGRTCSSPRQANDSITRLKQECRVLRRDLDAAVEAEKKFLKR